MLPQKNFFVKRPRWQIVASVVLGMVLFTAVILSVFSQSETFNYLPVIFNEPGDTPAPCPVQFAATPQAGENAVLLTGETGSIVSIVNLTTGETMGTDRVEEAIGYECPGLSDYASPYQLSGALTADHELQAQSDDGSGDTAVVSADPSTTPAAPGLNAVPILTTTTPLPPPYPSIITLQPICGTPQSNPGVVAFDVIFADWPTDHSLTLFWAGNLVQSWEAGQHAGSFTQSYTRSVSQNPVTYTVTAVSGNGSSDSEIFTVPCPSSDLLVYGPPQLISTPPIVAYQPVQFAVPITNAGDYDINSQFFVDIYLDLNPEVVLSTTIPITESDGYTAVSWLAADASRIITITAPLGFGNEPVTHTVYGFVDSLAQISETNETNNITAPLEGVIITPAVTHTPTSTPPGSNPISGIIYRFEDEFMPQLRVPVWLIDDSSGNVVGMTNTDETGHYEFTGFPPPLTTYSVYSFITIDNQDYYGYRSSVIPPQDLVYISLLARPCSDTPTPTATPTNTPTSTSTATSTATATPTDIPICAVQFEGDVIAGQEYVSITGEVGSIVTIVDLTDSRQQIGVGTLVGPFSGHACPGFVVISVPPSEVIQGHILAAISSDGTNDTIFVLGGTPTPTPTYTPTPTVPPGSRTPDDLRASAMPPTALP